MNNEGRSLAELLYVDLVGRLMFPTGATSSAAKPNPENIAKMCIKLAEAFDAVKKQSDIDAIPVTTKFEIDAADLARWDSK